MELGMGGPAIGNLGKFATDRWDEPRFESLFGVRCGHLAHEGRVDGIPEQRLYAGGHLAHLFGGNREIEILLGARPGFAILIGERAARRVAGIGRAAVKQGARKNHAGPGRHLDRTCGGFCVFLQLGIEFSGPSPILTAHFLIAPQVAAGNHLGGPILYRKIIHRHDRRKPDHRARTGDRVERVVCVKGLRRFTGMNVDDLARRQKKIRLEEMVADRHDAGVFDDVLENLVPGHQCVDTFGGGTLEIIATVITAEHGLRDVAHLGENAGGQELANHRESLRFDLIDAALNFRLTVAHCDISPLPRVGRGLMTMADK